MLRSSSTVISKHMICFNVQSAEPVTAWCGYETKKRGERAYSHRQGRTTPTRPTNGRSAGLPQPTATCRDLAWVEDQYALCVTSRGGPSRDSPHVSRRVRRSCQIVCPRASIACRNCNFRPTRAGGVGHGPQSQFRTRLGARDSRSVHGQHPTIRTKTPG